MGNILKLLYAPLRVALLTAVFILGHLLGVIIVPIQVETDPTVPAEGEVQAQLNILR